MQRVPKDSNIKSSYEFVPKTQTYRNLIPPKQNLDPHKSQVPFHFYTNNTPTSQSDSQFLTPKSPTLKK